MNDFEESKTRKADGEEKGKKKLIGNYLQFRQKKPKIVPNRNGNRDSEQFWKRLGQSNLSGQPETNAEGKVLENDGMGGSKTSLWAI